MESKKSCYKNKSRALSEQKVYAQIHVSDIQYTAGCPFATDQIC